MISRRLEMFLLVAEHGSFAKAASAMYLSSVSVKKQIDSLEAEVGTRLFDRTNRGATLTPAGEAFYRDARKIPALCNRAISHARRAGQEARMSIRIGTSLIRPCTPLVNLWERIGGSDIPFDLQIVPFEDDKIEDVVSILGRNIDCFVAPCDSNRWRETRSIYVLCDVPMKIAMPKSHRLAAKDILTWSDLNGETLLLPHSNDFTIIPQLENEIHSSHPEITIETTMPHTAAEVFNQCSQDGCLMIGYSFWDHVHPMLKTLSVDWDYSVPYGIVYAGSPSPNMAQFIHAIESGIADLNVPVEEALEQ